MIAPQDLVTPATSDQVMNGWVKQLVALGVPADQWRKGGVLRTILAVFAISVAGFSTILSAFVSGFFLPWASGNYLKLLAFYVYGVTPKAETFASGGVSVVNQGTTIKSFNDGEFTAKNAVTGKTYKLGAFSVAPGARVDNVPVTAVERGSASNASPGQISVAVTTAIGLVLTNPASVVGLDAQSDDDLRATCFSAIAALSPNGPSGAYDYAIRTATRPDGTPINVNRWQVLPDSSTGLVPIYIASPSGAASADDIAVVQRAIEGRFEKDVSTVLVQGTTTATFTAPITVWVRARAGLSAASLASQVSAALLAFFSTYPIGGLRRLGDGQGKVYASGIEGVARAVSTDIFAIDGARDVPLYPGQVPVFAAQVYVQQVAP